jgi:hypothetical protein
MRRLPRQEAAKYNTAPLQRRGLARSGPKLLKTVANQQHADKTDHEEPVAPLRKPISVDEDIDREPESSSDEESDTPKGPSQNNTPRSSQSQSQDSAEKRKRKRDDEELDLHDRSSLYQNPRRPSFLKKRKYGGNRETASPMVKPKKPAKNNTVLKNIHAKEESPETKAPVTKGQ